MVYFPSFAPDDVTTMSLVEAEHQELAGAACDWTAMCGLDGDVAWLGQRGRRGSPMIDCVHVKIMENGESRNEERGRG